MTSIKKQLISGSIYNGLAKYLTMFCNIVVTAILARIIHPEDFGVVAITTVIISFFDLFADIGLGPAIIQSKNLSRSDFSNIFTFSGIFALFLATVFFAMAVPLSSFYNEDRLIPLLRLLSVQLFFTALSVLPRSLMLKNKRFKQISIVTVSNVAFWGVVSVIAAKLGLGIFSLLITPIGVAVCNFILYFFLCQETIRFTFHPSFSSLKKLLSFSLYQFGFNCINYFSRNLDKLLIGKKLGMTDLGYYEKSYRMMLLPLSSLSQVFAPTIQPILSEFDTQKSVISSVYCKLSKYLLAIGSVLTPFLFFSSKELILLVFGDQWINAIPIFRILSISVLFQLLDSISSAFLQAANVPRYLFASGLICAILNVSCILIGLFLFDDLYKVAFLVSMAFCLNLWISVYYIVIKTFHQTIGSYLQLFIKPIIACLLVSIALYCINFLQGELSLIVLCLIKFIITGAIFWIFYTKSDYIDISSRVIKSLL